jgi:hypothetical protein
MLMLNMMMLAQYVIGTAKKKKAVLLDCGECMLPC